MRAATTGKQFLKQRRLSCAAFNAGGLLEQIVCQSFLFIACPWSSDFTHRTQVSKSPYEFSNLRLSVRPSSSFRTIQARWNDGGLESEILAVGPSSHFAGAVGMRSHASRRRLSDHDIRCSASDRRWFPARPAQHVHRRRHNGGPNTIGTCERAWQKRQKTRRDMQHRTRRSASTIGGAAPDTIIGRAAADRAGARPYRATRCENASKCATAGSRRRPILNPTTSPL